MSSDAAVNDRLRYLEDGFKLYRTKMDSLCKEMKILVAEINIITEWIHGSFGIELINKKSFLYKHIHDYEDVQEISESLTMLAQQVTTRSTPMTITTASPSPSSSTTGTMSNGALGIYNASGSSTHPPRPPPPTTPRSSLIAIPISTITSSPNDHNTSNHNHGVSHSQGHPNVSVTNHSSSIRADQQQQQTTFILPGSPPPSVGRPPSPPTPTPNNSRPAVRSGQSGQSQLGSGILIPTTPSRPPPHPPAIALFHPSPHNLNQVIIHGPPLQIHGSTPVLTPTAPKIPISLTLPRISGHSTLTISKKNKPDQEQRSVNQKKLAMATPVTLPQPVPNIQPLQPPPLPITSIVVPLTITNTTPNYMPPKKIIRKNYQNQQQQLQQQSQADITKYFKPVVVFEQPPPQTPQSEADEEASQEDRQKAALQLIKLHNQLEGRPQPPSGQGETSTSTSASSEVRSTRHHHHHYHHHHHQNDPDHRDLEEEVEELKIVEESEALIDVGMEEVEVVEEPEVEAGIEVADRPKKSSRKKLDFSKVEDKSEMIETTAPTVTKKRQSLNLDYSADADDEGISSDSTPAALNNKGTTKDQKNKGTKKTVLAPAVPASNGSNLKGVGGTNKGKRPRSRTPIPSATTPAKTTPTNIILKDGERPSTSKLSCAGSEAEESGFGKPPEKLPKRGRPKKKPEDRVRTYDPRVPMMCDECGKVLKGSGALRVHKQIHANIRPHECKECGKAFRRKHHLEFHMMIHAGDKKETCSYCGKAFLIRRDLARHERTHTGEKPYGCTLCPKSFNVKQHLTLHIRTHTGERPYRCLICDKTFTQANSLRIHKKIHVRDAANGTTPINTGKKGGAGGGVGVKGKSTPAPNSASTSGVSSANTSALETPPERILGSRAPSRANSVISISGSEAPSHQSYHGSGRPFHSQSPSPNSCSSFTSSVAPPHHQYQLGRLSYEHDQPPPVGETVVVVTSPLPPAHSGHPHSYGHGPQLSPNYHPHHPHQYNSSFMNPSPWRLALNPGSGTNLLHSPSRSPTPPGHGPQPLPAHNNTPITVIRPLTNRSGGGQRSYHSMSPHGSGSGFEHGGGGGNNEEGRRSPGGRSTASSPSSQSFPYDGQHVTRYY